ncbi:regulatory protein [Streptococcus pneumoniae]|nr:regulatory protein [Streptococcus pneumoniae]
MEKAECGQFSILSFLLQESQTTVKAAMEETGFSKATLTKYVTLLNDKALDSGLELTIHSEDGKSASVYRCSYQGERYSELVFG